MTFTAFKIPVFLLLGAVCLNFHLTAGAKQLQPRPAPEFTHQESANWINSSPLTVKDLRGKVVMLDFWTFDCWNCYRSFPWLTELEDSFKDQPFEVIGVHTPEFEHERKIARVRDKVKGFGLGHPVMIDNDFSFWNAMQARYWPSFFLIDKQGMIRASFVGETHSGDEQAKEVEQKIRDLLAE